MNPQTITFQPRRRESKSPITVAVDALCYIIMQRNYAEVILKCGHGIGITPKQKDRPARLLLMNGLESYSVVLAALDRSAVRFGLRREPQKDSCKAAQGKCSFPWDGIGLAHKRQLRFHRAVCKTAISPERCIIAPFILKGFGRCCVREHHAPSLQAPARLQADETRFSEVPSPDRRSVLPDRPESFPAFRHGCKDDAHALSGSALTSGVQGSSRGADKSVVSALLWLFRCGGRLGLFSVGSMASPLHKYGKVRLSNMDVNDFLQKVAEPTDRLHDELFSYGNCSLIYVDPYNFGTVQISRLHAILRSNYCELLFNLFTCSFFLT